MLPMMEGNHHTTAPGGGTRMAGLARVATARAVSLHPQPKVQTDFRRVLPLLQPQLKSDASVSGLGPT